MASPGAALVFLNRWSAISTATRCNTRLSLRIAYLAEAELLDGKADLASELAGEALQLAKTYGERPAEGHVHRLLGDIAWRRTPMQWRHRRNMNGPWQSRASTPWRRWKAMPGRPATPPCETGQRPGTTGRRRLLKPGQAYQMLGTISGTIGWLSACTTLGGHEAAPRGRSGIA